MPIQDEFPFASLDFPGRTTLYLHEVAERLGVSSRHVADLIEEGQLAAINIAGESATSRKHYRIPVESYRQFVTVRLSAPYRAELLSHLPRTTLRQLMRELENILQ